MSQSNSTLFPTPIDVGKVAKEGPNSVRVPFDFSVSPSYTVDMTLIKTQGKISIVQSVFIDNAANNQPISITVSGTKQMISVPASFQGIFPLFVTGSPTFVIASTGTGLAEVHFCNVQQSPFMWQAIAIPLNVGGTLATADAILDATVTANRVGVSAIDAPATIVDNSGTIAVGGTSQIAAAAVANRRGFLLQNLDAAENLYVRVGAAAAIDTPGTYLLGPYATLQGVGAASINVNAATGAHKFTLTEW